MQQKQDESSHDHINEPALAQPIAIYLNESHLPNNFSKINHI